jgi:hypothetical protein
MYNWAVCTGGPSGHDAKLMVCGATAATSSLFDWQVMTHGARQYEAVRTKVTGRFWSLTCTAAREAAARFKVKARCDGLTVGVTVRDEDDVMLVVPVGDTVGLPVPEGDTVALMDADAVRVSVGEPDSVPVSEVDTDDDKDMDEEIDIVDVGVTVSDVVIEELGVHVLLTVGVGVLVLLREALGVHVDDIVPVSEALLVQVIVPVIEMVPLVLGLSEPVVDTVSDQLVLTEADDVIVGEPDSDREMVVVTLPLRLPLHVLVEVRLNDTDNVLVGVLV